MSSSTKTWEISQRYPKNDGELLVITINEKTILEPDGLRIDASVMPLYVPNGENAEAFAENFLRENELIDA